MLTMHCGCLPTHGMETRNSRTDRSLASARLTVLESVGFALNMLTGTRTRGRKRDS